MKSLLSIPCLTGKEWESFISKYVELLLASSRDQKRSLPLAKSSLALKVVKLQKMGCLLSKKSSVWGRARMLL